MTGCNTYCELTQSAGFMPSIFGATWSKTEITKGRLTLLRNQTLISQIPNGRKVFDEFIRRNTEVIRVLNALNQNLDFILSAARGDLKKFTRGIIDEVVSKLANAVGKGADVNFRQNLEQLFRQSAARNYGVFNFAELAALNVPAGLDRLGAMGLSDTEIRRFSDEVRTIVSTGDGPFADRIEIYYRGRADNLSSQQAAVRNLSDAVKFERQLVDEARSSIVRMVSGIQDGSSPVMSSRNVIGLIRPAHEMPLDRLNSVLVNEKKGYSEYLLKTRYAVIFGAGAAVCLVPIVYELLPETLDTDNDDSSNEAGDSDLGK